MIRWAKGDRKTIKVSAEKERETKDEIRKLQEEHLAICDSDTLSDEEIDIKTSFISEQINDLIDSMY